MSQEVKESNRAVPTVIEDFSHHRMHKIPHKENHCGPGCPCHAATVPAANVCETENHFILELATPGWPKSALNVTFLQGNLTVSTNGNPSTQAQCHRHEIETAPFAKSFVLPGYVNENDLKATYHDGLLRVEFRKREPAPGKTIIIPID